MGATFQVQSCCEFLTGHPSHTSRCASYLLFELKGQTKIISVARSALDIVEYTTRGHEPTHGHISFANEMLGDVKIVLNFANTPAEIASLSRKFKKTGESYQAIYVAYRNGEHVGHRAWILAGARSAGVVKKTLSVAGDGFFKPMQLTGKAIDLGATGKTIGETWQVLSVIKSGAKIANNSGKLYLGTRKPAKKVVDITLEAWELTYTIIRLNHGSIHPVGNIVLSVCKSVFGLIEAWVKTT